MVGAGSVLTKSTNDFELWYGNPAVHKGYVTKSGLSLNLDFKDSENNTYKFENNDLLLIK
jgi:hypothetical protein